MSSIAPRSVLAFCRRVLRSPRLLAHRATVKLSLLFGGLESPVAKLRRCVDEFQVDHLDGNAAHLRQKRLPERQNAAARSHRLALDHHPVLRHVTVMSEPSHGRDRLFRQVHLSHGAMGIVLERLADAVDLLVDLGAVVVPVLTSTRDLKRNTRRMPRANAAHLPETTVRLPRKPGDAPARDHPIVSMTTSGADEIDHLILREDICNLDLLLKETGDKVNLLLNGTAIDLDLLDVRLLLPDLNLADL